MRLINNISIDYSSQRKRYEAMFQALIEAIGYEKARAIRDAIEAQS